MGPSSWAQTQFLYSPNFFELQPLSHLYDETGVQLPVHIVYTEDTEELLGIGISTSAYARNGIHGRLLYSLGFVETLQRSTRHRRSDGTENHSFSAGTLFLERQAPSELGGRELPVLAVHQRNSHRSTVNSAFYVTRIPRSVLAQVSELTGVSVSKPSAELDATIYNENVRCKKSNPLDPMVPPAPSFWVQTPTDQERANAPNDERRELVDQIIQSHRGRSCKAVLTCSGS